MNTEFFYSDELAESWSNDNMLNLHFVNEKKKPLWFWKMYRKIYEKITGKTIVAGVFFSVDLGSPDPCVATAFESMEGTLYV